MSDVATNSASKKWGDLSSRFARLPIELFLHYREIGLSDFEFRLIVWLDFHQWGERPTFIHPAKSAIALNVTETEIVSKLKELHTRNLIVIEPTESNPRNFHQNLRPLRNKLRVYLKANPEHCAWMHNNKIQRIDISILKSPSDTSNPKDISILSENKRGGTSSIADILNNRKKKD